MAIVYFSIPRKINDEFETTFVDRNKSAIIAGLMRDAIERERQRGKQTEAIDELLMMRATLPKIGNRSGSGRMRR